jgi:CheY-like chemotaxis protein
MDNSEFARLREPIAFVVDDEPLVLMDHVYMIAEEGYAIVEATTALQAYEFLEQHSSLQLLFTDVETPGEIDGFELARKVAVKWPHIAIVVASGAAHPQPGDLPDGATFIAKPLSAAMVHEAILEHLKKP